MLGTSVYKTNWHLYSATGQEKLSDRYKADPKLSFIIKAIYTMAYGLHNMYQDVCGRDAVGLCPDLFPFNGSLFKVRHIVYRRYTN